MLYRILYGGKSILENRYEKQEKARRKKHLEKCAKNRRKRKSKKK